MLGAEFQALCEQQDPTTTQFAAALDGAIASSKEKGIPVQQLLQMKRIMETHWGHPVMAAILAGIHVDTEKGIVL